MRALDFGKESKLCIHGSEGPVPVPGVSRGLTPAQKFADRLRILLTGENDLFGTFPGDDVVMESPTIGSSGAEPDLIREIVRRSRYDIYIIPARAVKNFKRRHGVKDDDDRMRFPGIPELDAIGNDDVLSAAIIYRLAEENPDRLRKWNPDGEGRYIRKHKSVRPYDQRLYRDPQVDEWMSLLPSFGTLPADMQEVFGDGKDYSRSRMLPFAMALEEDISRTREGYEKVLGLYGQGYGSFYRRAAENLRQYIAKKYTGIEKIDDLTEEQHKESLRITRWYIRNLYHRAQGKANPAMGNSFPVQSGKERCVTLKGKGDPATGMKHPSLFDI